MPQISVEYLLKEQKLIVQDYLNCSFGDFHPIREFFIHMETSLLPVKGCKFWSMFGTLRHRVVRILGFFSVPHLLWHGASVYNNYLSGLVTLINVHAAERLAVELRSVRAGIRNPTCCMRGERFNRFNRLHAPPPRQYSSWNLYKQICH